MAGTSSRKAYWTRGNFSSMTGRARPDRSMCNICGAEMPIYEIEDHQRHAHPVFLAQRQRAFANAAFKAALIYVPSGVAFLLALFVPDAILGISEPGWYLGVVFLGLMATWVAPLPFLAKKRRAYVKVVGDILEQCPICDAKVPFLKRWAHMANDHPGEFRRFRATEFLSRGSLLGILVGVIAVLWGSLVGIFPFAWGDLAHTMMYVALVGWGGVIGLWGVLVERPYKAKLRAEWQAAHFAAQARPR